MNNELKRPMVLIIRDGWGDNPNADHDEFNGIKLSNTPCTDGLMAEYPWTLIRTSGEEVGLPDGTMGNSEVGHQNIGAGRTVNQESVRITKAIRSGEFYYNPVLIKAIETAKANGKWIHFMGLISDAGVHSLISHLYGCVEMCVKLGHEQVAIHAFMDGRDTGPFTGKGYLREVEKECSRIGAGRVVSISGRYYAMDRDNRWDRVERAYNMLTGRDKVMNFETCDEAMDWYYANPTNGSQEGDEFVEPCTVGGDFEGSKISDGDTIFFFNYRGDRPRELTKAFVMPKFEGCVPASPSSGKAGFDRGEKLDLHFVTMTAYEEALNEWVDVAYPKLGKMVNICGEWMSEKGLKQFRCAETEKFPHVTFFFNDYREEPFGGEARRIVPSPKVATYDLQPEMSGVEVRDAVLDALDCEYDLIVVNFANGDMVGHTGKLGAVIKAVEVVDGCVGAICEKAMLKGGGVIVTADHGNAEQMWSPENNSAHTAHTTYPVPLIVVDDRYADEKKVELRSDGTLADVIPTAFALMGLVKPDEMTGESLLE